MQTTFEGFLSEAIVANPRRNADMFAKGWRKSGGVGSINKMRQGTQSMASNNRQNCTCVTVCKETSCGQSYVGRETQVKCGAEPGSRCSVLTSELVSALRL